MARFHRILRAGAALGLVGALSACGGMFGGDEGLQPTEDSATDGREGRPVAGMDAYYNTNAAGERTTIWEVFGNQDDPNVTVEVNRYIWNASLEVLDFLPVRTVDPFSGVFTTGYGTPPGGGRAYRATVHVKDPALDARSLVLALDTRNGPASAETVRAIEDAILTRARQLRVRDRDL